MPSLLNLDVERMGFLWICFLEHVGAVLWLCSKLWCARTQHQVLPVAIMAEMSIFGLWRTYLIPIIVPLASKKERVNRIGNAAKVPMVKDMLDCPCLVLDGIYTPNSYVKLTFLYVKFLVIGI